MLTVNFNYGTVTNTPTNTAITTTTATIRFNDHFSRWTWLAGFIRAKDDGDGGDNWSYKTCKARVKSLPSTKQDLAFYRPDALRVAQPTVTKHWSEHSYCYCEQTTVPGTTTITTISLINHGSHKDFNRTFRHPLPAFSRTCYRYFSGLQSTFKWQWSDHRPK